MIDVTGAQISASVSDSEYKRLLGLPQSRALEDDLLDRATAARAWYAENGNPFIAWRRVTIRSISTPSVFLENGTGLSSAQLARALQDGEANALVIMAVTAGTEVAEEVARLWGEGLPDEAFFLDRFAVAVTEHLVFWASAVLCRSAESARETLMPHLSPGCGNWDLADQHKLMAMLVDRTTGPIRLLDSGALHPQHSYLTVMGVTSKKVAATPRDLCRACDLQPCAFRRAPYVESVAIS